MSKTVRIILSIAFAIFVAGIIWAIVATRNNKNDSTTKTANTPTLVGTPSSTTAPAVTTPAVTTPATTVPATTATTPTAKKAVTRYHIEYDTETIEESSSSAWASAGTNADGSTWAEAHAE